MTRLLMILILAAALLPGNLQAIDQRELPELVNVRTLPPSEPVPAGAAVDTLYLLGGPGQLSGKFQDASGLPDRQGWLGVDLTQPGPSHWSVSSFNAANLDPGTPDNHAWWCGDIFEPCHPEDPPEGSGDDWFEALDWSAQVADPAQGVTVRVRAVVNYNTDAANDFVYLQVLSDNYPIDLLSLTGIGTGHHVDATHVLTPADYLGLDLDEVRLRWLFRSDGAWSDEDCNWPSNGAAQIDSITVTFDQGSGAVLMGTVETCEPGDPLNWQPTDVRGTGDYSKVWPLLEDLDPLAENDTPQFAFIDDGVVVPGTGGSACLSWCYGPGGWIVNPETGVSELGDAISNEIWSPVLTTPAVPGQGALLAFDVYVHGDIDNGAPYTFPTWRIRSTDDPAGIAGWTEWRDNNLALWGAPTYVRSHHNLTDLLVPGFTHVQIALGVQNFLYVGGLDGTPAPYYDNVALKVYPRSGAIALRVLPDGNGDYPTIQAAILAAAGGDTVLLGDGVFSGHGNRDLTTFGKPITIISQSGDPNACIIDCGGSAAENHRGFNLNQGEGPDTVISGLTICNGYMVRSGGALSIRGASPTVTNCVFRDNVTDGVNNHGGAIFCQDASPLIDHCTFEGNQGSWGGAIGAPWDSQPVITDCLFVGNVAGSLGAGVLARYYESSVTVRRCTFYQNTDSQNKGTLSTQFDAHLVVENCIVVDGLQGRGVWCEQGGSMDISCTNISGNPGGDWIGCASGLLGLDGNISDNPLFCQDQNPDDPFTLHLLSPCAETSCGTMGARLVACSDPTAVDDQIAALSLRLHANYPNPFNPQTVLRFELDTAGPVKLLVYDLQGRLVRRLVDEDRLAGPHEARWDGRDTGGRLAASGAYMVRLEAGGQTVSRQIMR